jgi:NTE family protein
MSEVTNNPVPKAGVGLVLDGGGGKGAYQVGVLKALSENGFLDDVTAISGASIGAVNAMLYAMDDIDIMYRAWDDIDMLTVFDIDLDMLLERKPYFSREEMLKLVSKYIDFNKIKNGRYDIYCSICRMDTEADNPSVEYRRLADYDTDTIKNILLASTALPIIYESVEIDGSYYRDGGICDNEPIQPLYDAGIRQFIVIGLNSSKIFDGSKWPDASFITIYPSHDLGNLLEGTLNFSEKSIDFREMLGEKDGLRSIKTKFQPDDIYIRMEPLLAQNDYNEITMKLRADSTYNTMKSKVDANIEKFEALAKKYENI